MQTEQGNFISDVGGTVQLGGNEETDSREESAQENDSNLTSVTFNIIHNPVVVELCRAEVLIL